MHDNTIVMKEKDHKEKNVSFFTKCLHWLLAT